MIFSKENLPQDGWKPFIKLRHTNMTRIDGPFEVDTREGRISCQDGYLAVDSGGFPYPIATDEHHRTYIYAGCTPDFDQYYRD